MTERIAKRFSPPFFRNPPPKQTMKEVMMKRPKKTKRSTSIVLPA